MDRRQITQRMLHDEANRNLFFIHENNKKLRAANKRVWDREHIFASAWEQSKTGLLSGCPGILCLKKIKLCTDKSILKIALRKSL